MEWLIGVLPLCSALLNIVTSLKWLIALCGIRQVATQVGEGSTYSTPGLTDSNTTTHLRDHHSGSGSHSVVHMA